MQTMIMWFYKLFQSGPTPERQLLNGQRKAELSPSSASPNLSYLISSPTRLDTLPLPDNQPRFSEPQSVDYGQLPSYVDACYFNWLAGAADEQVDQDRSFENKMLEYLNSLAESDNAGSNLIPRVPSVMVQLLKRLHEDNVSSVELSRIISQDVVLVAALLSEVNSSFYNLPKKVTDISQAILMLGHTRLRMVLAKISFTPIYNERLGAASKLTASKIWEQSQKRALACSILAKSQNVDQFMAFLAGLMHDVGLIVALRVFDRSGNAQFPTSTSFRHAFLECARVLSTRIGTIWQLPEVVIKAIEAQDPDFTAEPLTVLLQRADFLSKTCTLIAAGELDIDMDALKSSLVESEMDCLVTLLDPSKQVA